MKTKSFRLLFLATVLALFAGCESDDGYGGSSVNVYGSVGYSSGFYDPWYGGGYGGGGIIVSPPARPVRPAQLPSAMPRARRR